MPYIISFFIWWLWY